MHLRNSFNHKFNYWNKIKKGKKEKSFEFGGGVVTQPKATTPFRLVFGFLGCPLEGQVWDESVFMPIPLISKDEVFKNHSRFCWNLQAIFCLPIWSATSHHKMSSICICLYFVAQRVEDFSTQLISLFLFISFYFGLID